jgi:type VI secretion system protein ImpH
VSFRDGLKAEPWLHDFFVTMRELERSSPDKPRIGASMIAAEDVVRLGQDPYLDFPASNLTEYSQNAAGIPNIKTRFLGFFGPQGALPLTTTVEAYGWSQQHDPSFARFTDLFANRFQQFFYRAWADARPIAQYERPAADRFFHYVGTACGIGSEAFRNRDRVDDIAKVGFAGLVGAQVKSASRLAQFISGVFGIAVEVVERIGSWLVFEPGDRMALGAHGGSLGSDAVLGTRAFSINDKIRIRIDASTLVQYRRFLPPGDLSEKLTDLVFFYIGHRFDFDVELGLRADLAPPVRLGQSGELGWTAWIAPKPAAEGEVVYIRDARFNPMERRSAAPAQKPRTVSQGK